MDVWTATKNALVSLEQSLLCSACSQLLTKPCTLGSCNHLICKSCAGQYTGNSCPVCHAPAWAKDLQIKRELSMVVKLYQRLDRLINSGTECSDSSNMLEKTDGRDDNPASHPSPASHDGSETDPISISDSDVGMATTVSASIKQIVGPNGLWQMTRRGNKRPTDVQKILSGSDTESMSGLDSDQQKQSERKGSKRRKALQEKKVLVDQVQSDVKSTKSSKKTPDTGLKRMGKGKKRKSSKNAVQESATKQTSSSDQMPSLTKADENDPLGVYEFVASPPRPKMPKLTVQQVKREAQLKKLAAANKEWRKISEWSQPSEGGGGKHVSFCEDKVPTESFSVEDINSDHDGRNECLVGEPGSDNGEIFDMHSSGEDGKITAAAETRHPSQNGLPSEMGKRADNYCERENHDKNLGLRKTRKRRMEEQVCQEIKEQETRCDPTTQKAGKKSSRKARSKDTKSSPGLTKEGENRGKPLAGKNNTVKEQGARMKGGKNTKTSIDNGPAFNSPSMPASKQSGMNAETTRHPRKTPRSSPSPRIRSKDVHVSPPQESPSPRSTSSSPGGAVMKRNKRGETPLHVACIKGNISTVKSLLEQGADPNCKDHAGWTPLHESCNHGHTTLVSLLLDHGALINAPGFEHDSPLHDAVSNYRLDVVRYLRQRGASLDSRNIHGQTPLDLATTSEMKEALMTPPQGDPQGSSESTSLSLASQHLQDQQVVLLSTGLQLKDKLKLQMSAKLLGGRVVEEFSTDVTHLVAACQDDGCCMRTMKYLQCVLTGRWVVNAKWLHECVEKKQRVPEIDYEIPGTTADPDSHAAKMGRENMQKQFPGLFDGCLFYFTGKFTFPTPPKAELMQLIKLGGGAILNRQPKPDDDVIQTSTVVPYHARPESQLASCAHYIVYDHLGNRAPPVLRTLKVCTVPVWWVLDCVSQFSLLDPPRE